MKFQNSAARLDKKEKPEFYFSAKRKWKNQILRACLK
jgi:hypothetical protein